MPIALSGPKRIRIQVMLSDCFELRQVSGAAIANANITYPARAVTDTARRQVQRFVRPQPAMGSMAALVEGGHSNDNFSEFLTGCLLPENYLPVSSRASRQTRKGPPEKSGRPLWNRI
jgi:hypothetical protein